MNESVYINQLWASANSCVAKCSLRPHTLMASLSLYVALHPSLFTATRRVKQHPPEAKELKSFSLGGLHESWLLVNHLFLWFWLHRSARLFIVNPCF